MSNLRSNCSSVNPSVEGSHPPSSITWGGEILSKPYRSPNNIDTIHFGLFVNWSDERFLLELESLRDKARENNFTPVPFGVPGLNMQFAANPSGKRRRDRSRERKAKTCL